MYGTASASFLTIRCLEHFYIDILLTGADNVGQAGSLNKILLVYFLEPDLLCILGIQIRRQLKMLGATLLENNSFSPEISSQSKYSK